MYPLKYAEHFKIMSFTKKPRLWSFGLYGGLARIQNLLPCFVN